MSEFAKRFKEPGGYYDQSMTMGVTPVVAARFSDAPSHPKMLLGGAAVGGLAGGLIGNQISSKVKANKKTLIAALRQDMPFYEKMGITPAGRSKKKAIKRAIESLGKRSKLALGLGVGGAALGALLAHGFNTSWRTARKAQEAQGIHKQAGIEKVALRGLGGLVTMVRDALPKAGLLGTGVGEVAANVGTKVKTFAKGVVAPVAATAPIGSAVKSFGGPSRAISGIGSQTGWKP